LPERTLASTRHALSPESAAGHKGEEPSGGPPQVQPMNGLLPETPPQIA
jgi:hypothetical protein